MYNYINLSGNTQIPFQVDSGCTVVSEFDDIVSTGASIASGTGVLKYINSIDDGSLKVSGSVTVGGKVRCSNLADPLGVQVFG